jgi:alcohol dehydrogenase class IV
VTVPDLTFRSAGEIVFGRGTLERIGSIASRLGSHAMLVRGGRHLDASRTIARLETLLGDAGVRTSSFTVRGEPDVETVDRAASEARSCGADLVVGIGGGSALDAAKAVAGLLTNEGGALDYMEVVGAGRTIESPAAPLVAVPTTAGTGTEVTKNAVITSREKSFKASMRSPHLVPDVALVDPALTDFMPRRVTAATGLDALTQLVEAHVTRRANPITDALSLQGIGLASRSLVRACESGDDARARDAMALAALLSGLCLANAGLGAVHGFAAPLGAAFPVPHGVACAALLPHVMEKNIAALRRDEDGGPVLERYDRVGAALGAGDADGAVAMTRDLVRELEIPPLSRFGIGPGDVDVLVERAAQASSMKGNPVTLERDVLAHVLRAAMGP